MSLDPAVRRYLCIYRIAQGITQRQLAARMETSQSHVCDLENGKREPGVGTLARWAEALGLTMRISFDTVPDPIEAVTRP